MKKYDISNPYAAAYVILRKDNKIAFVLRTNTGWNDGNYGLPSGKVEKYETFREGAIREAKEEIGVTIKAENLKHILTGHRKDETEWVDMVFEASAWEGEPYNAEPDVHGELVWLEPTDLPDNMVPSVKEYIKQILLGNSYAESKSDA